MPKKTLYSLITTQDTRDRGFEPIELMQMFGTQLEAAAIHSHISSAMAAVLGHDPSRKWCLCEVSKNSMIPMPATKVAYTADEQTRYFFVYATSSPATQNGTGSHPIVILEYSRLDLFEIRASYLIDTGFQAVKVSSAYIKESLTAMLLAILTHEKNNANYIALATNFKKEYAAKFSKGPQSSVNMIEAIHSELLNVINPSMKDTVECFFDASSVFLNASDGYLRPLLNNESIGYLSNEELNIHLGPNCDAKFLLIDEQSTTQSPSMLEELFLVEPIPEGFITAVPASTTLTQGIYPIHPGRALSLEEQNRVPMIPSWYIMTPQVVRVTEAIYRSNEFHTPIRNVLLRGGAGTGKTEGAKAMASMFSLPYGHLTGHAEMEFFDLTSMLVPKTDEVMATLEQQVDFFTFALKNSDFKIPSFSELENFPDMAYQQITGIEKEDAVPEDCFAALLAKLTATVKSDATLFTGSDSKFKTVRSDLVQGLEKGWLIELQEMNTIQKPGVLVGLNSILENGRLTLPTGEIICRHPDSVIVFTQNVNYAGVGDTNQSVLSRLGIKCDLRQPTEDEMVERILSHVPQLDISEIRRIVQICAEIRDKCSAEIEGGSVGTREAIAWAEMTYLLGNVKEAAEYTILPSCTEDPDDRTRIKTSVLDLFF